MIDLFKGKLCCPSCHHLISLEGKPQEDCPYCKKKLPKEERDCWETEEYNRELRRRSFESNLEEKEGNF